MLTESERSMDMEMIIDGMIGFITLAAVVVGITIIKPKLIRYAVGRKGGK